MTPKNETPDWFQLTQGDAAKPSRKIKRGARVLALAAPLLLLGAGIVVAQTQDGPNAIANETVSLTTSDSVQSPDLAQSVENAPANSTAPIASTKHKTAIVNTNHSISLTPTAKGDDEAEDAFPAPVSVPTTSATTNTSQPATMTVPPIKPPTSGEGDEGEEEYDD